MQDERDWMVNESTAKSARPMNALGSRAMRFAIAGWTSWARTPSCRLEQGLGGNFPISVEFPSHLHGQSAFARQNVRSALARSDQPAEIGLREAPGRHPVPDGLDRIRRVDRPVLLLVVLDDECQQVEAVRLRRPKLWLLIEVRFDLVKRRLIIGLCTQGTDRFFRHETVSG